MLPVALGTSGPNISPVVFGSQSFSRRDPEARVRTLHAAIDAGITSIDTAPLYGFGEAERIVGRAIADRRGSVQILGKVGLRWDDDHGDVLFETRTPDGRPLVVRRDGRPRSVRSDVEQSLQSLGIEALDLCQVHHPDPSVPIADTVGELLRLRGEGKLRAIGVSNFSPQQVQEAIDALGDVPLCSVQSEYNLLCRGVERTLLPFVAEHGIGMLAYSPLMHGLLAGCMAGGRRLSFEDHRRFIPAFAPVNVPRVEAARERGLMSLARRRGVTPAEVALAWILHQPGVSAVIAGASDPSQARANARAAELRLRAGELAGLTAEFERVRLEQEPRSRRRDRIRERAERVVDRAWRGASTRLPWLPESPWS